MTADLDRACPTCTLPMAWFRKAYAWVCLNGTCDQSAVLAGVDVEIPRYGGWVVVGVFAADGVGVEEFREPDWQRSSDA